MSGARCLSHHHVCKLQIRRLRSVPVRARAARHARCQPHMLPPSKNGTSLRLSIAKRTQHDTAVTIASHHANACALQIWWQRSLLGRPCAARHARRGQGFRTAPDGAHTRWRAHWQGQAQPLPCQRGSPGRCSAHTYHCAFMKDTAHWDTSPESSYVLLKVCQAVGPMPCTHRQDQAQPLPRQRGSPGGCSAHTLSV